MKELIRKIKEMPFKLKLAIIWFILLGIGGLIFVTIPTTILLIVSISCWALLTIFDRFL